MGYEESHHLKTINLWLEALHNMLGWTNVILFAIAAALWVIVIFK
jgi:hypothetical protein